MSDRLRLAVAISSIVADCSSVEMCIRDRSYTHKLWRLLQQGVQNYVVGIPEKLSCIIYISKFSSNIIKKHMKNYSGKEVLIHNPISVFRRKQIDVRKNKTFVFLGRLSSEKNPTLLAKVGKQMQAKVLFIGDGECRKEIEEINPDAKITGWIEKKEIYKYLEIGRCLVFPSVWYEGEPLAVLECMAMGIPVIVSNVCAAQDNVMDGENGMIFRSNDEISLRNKMEKVMDDAVVDEMGKKAYEYFSSMNREKYFDVVLKAYKDVLLKK